MRRIHHDRCCRSLAPALVVALASFAGAARAEWTQVSDGVHALNPAIHETVWKTPRPPHGPHDWIEVHRYRGVKDGGVEYGGVESGGAGKPRAALLYLPGTWMNGEAALGDEEFNLWFFLAGRGVDVYTLDYRTHFVPSSGVEDLAFMKEWGLAAFVDDARQAAMLAATEGGHERLFVAGFSRGVTIAYGLAASDPERIAGVVALDGQFKSHAPKGEFKLEAAVEQLLGSGVFASDVAGPRGWQWREKLMAATIADPDGPAQDPKFATIGDELAQILYGAWGPGVLANPKDGVSRPLVLARLLAGYDRYYPTIQNVEGGSLADYADDPSTPIDDGWADLDAPVLYFGSTGMKHFGGGTWLQNGIHSAAEAGGADFTIHVLEGYGHLDVLVGERARAEVFEPTLEWIESRAQPAAAN